ncbi:MAG: sulfatase-like hydrolase/transferase [Acidobacteria bacterium]|nr:sulfatase-like hydrolase/transferase [Acidobacteriota bacterium]
MPPSRRPYSAPRPASPTSSSSTLTTRPSGPSATLATATPAPKLDRLARERAYFTSSFVTTPVCSPACASLMTSRYTLETGIEDYLSPETDAANGLPRNLPVWPKLLRVARYRTGLVGKWHLGSNPNSTPPPTALNTSPVSLGAAQAPSTRCWKRKASRRSSEAHSRHLHRSRAPLPAPSPQRCVCPATLSRAARLQRPGAGANRTWLPVPDDDWALPVSVSPERRSRFSCIGR